MTEAEWLSSTDPAGMLEFLRSKSSERKLRLFACACCRVIWEHFNANGRFAVEVAERYADGLASKKELQNASAIASIVREPPLGCGGREAAPSYTAHKRAWFAAEGSSRTSRVVFSEAWEVAVRKADRTNDRLDREAVLVTANNETNAISSDQVHLLRDIFGNPFQPVALDPAWLTPTVTTLANGIYTDRSFDRMPILADALEEAGCDNADVLLHCRGNGPHVKGCWVVDLVLGKE
jgi:hypothetical protein